MDCPELAKLVLPKSTRGKKLPKEEKMPVGMGDMRKYRKGARTKFGLCKR
jgi:hypothetical protein